MGPGPLLERERRETNNQEEDDVDETPEPFETYAMRYAKWLVENLEKSTAIHTKKATGSSFNFLVFWEMHSIDVPEMPDSRTDEENVRMFVKSLYGNAPDNSYRVHLPKECITLDVFGHVVVAHDTNGAMWVFTEGHSDAENEVCDFAWNAPAEGETP